MEINADFSKRAVVHAAQLPWTPSPMPGVERRMLDRVGEEVARATSIVRYAAGSQFSPHVHGGGEEFLVLDGVFSDQHGDYPAGFYIRNPPTSNHAPASAPGCTIFVKLWQFDPDDRTEVLVDSKRIPFEPHGDGVESKFLFRDTREEVRIERWAAGVRVVRAESAGLELLVLEGSFTDAGEVFEPQSWLRLPKGSELDIVAGTAGCQVWVKTAL